MKGLRISSDLTLPIEACEDVIAILGRRGRGKTTTASVMVEELHKAGARFCVTDPTGVWWGLKSSRDGKAPGIPVVVMGGEHQDVPLAPESGEVIADFVADPESPSVVLDLKPFTQGESVRFMTAFLARLYHRNQRPLHLVLDEADQFAPQRPMPGEQAMLGAAQRVTKMGRAKGLHPILITQRPATLNKNVLTQAGLLVAHAITGPQDRKAVDEWIKANADEGERERFLVDLAGLPRGTAYFWSPDLPVFKKVEVRDRETFDSSATPKHGAQRAQPKALAEVDLEGLKKRIAATIERAKAEDPRELRKQIADLKAQLARAQAAKPVAAPAARTVEKKVPAVDPKVTALVTTAMERLDAAGVQLRDLVEQRLRDLHEDLEALARIVARRVPAEISAAPPTQRPGPAPTAPRPTAVARPVPRLEPAPSATGDGNDRLTPASQRILDALAELEVLGVAQPERVQVAFLAGYSHLQSKGLVNGLGALRSAGLIDYPGDGRVVLTPEGRVRANAPARPLSPRELQERVIRLLGGASGRILEPLIEAYPNPVDREELARRANYGHLQSKGFVNAIGRLRSLGFIDYPAPGQVVARPVLFLEAAS